MDITSISSAINIIKSSIETIKNLKDSTNPKTIEIREQLFNV